MDREKPTREEIYKAIEYAKTIYPPLHRYDVNPEAEAANKKHRKKMKALKIASASFDMVTALAGESVAQAQIICSYQAVDDLQQQDEDAPKEEKGIELVDETKYTDNPEPKLKKNKGNSTT